MDGGRVSTIAGARRKKWFDVHDSRRLYLTRLAEIQVGWSGVVTTDPVKEAGEMDWTWLVRFALLGRSDWEQHAILLVRVSLGVFFAVSGGSKLFVAGGTKPVYDTLVKAKVPFPRQTAYFVASVEFVCGSLLVVGFLSSPASLAY